MPDKTRTLLAFLLGLHLTEHAAALTQIRQIPRFSRLSHESDERGAAGLPSYTSLRHPEAALLRAPASALRLRGGTSLDTCFNRYFIGLLSACALARFAAYSPSQNGEGAQNKAWNLQWRFLSVFWALKLADWLHGPYFYEVYASKVINGRPLGQDMIGKLFLCGFGASMVFGTVAGTLVDSMGRKKGCLAFCLLYILSALSTRSNSLALLVLGRILGGTATSLLFSAPEAWLVGEHSRQGLSGADLGATFGWAYFGDGIAAIAAGKLAGAVAGRAGGRGQVLSGPTAPFELSILFLVLGAVFISTNFQENYGGDTAASSLADGGGKGVLSSLAEAMQIILADRRILLTGVVQSLFEGAMYIFVLQWPPALRALAGGRQVPFGAVFSCLMTACMLGSSVFGLLLTCKVSVESTMAAMLGVTCVALATSANVMRGQAGMRKATSAPGDAALHLLVVSFFLFEMGVGLYFPSIGTLRSKYVPDAHKGSILNVFRVPLNLIVISTFLSINRLGVSGALLLASVVLGVACSAQCALLLEEERRSARAEPAAPAVGLSCTHGEAD